MKGTVVFVEGTHELNNGREIEWEAQVRMVYRPAKLSGPPEDCYPDESEAEIEALVTRPEGHENEIDEDKIIEKAWDKFPEMLAADKAEYYEYIRDSKEDR